MGKFDGFLLASDFDNTLVDSDAAIRTGTGIPAVSPENCAAIRAFMAEGGRFAISTGRALPAFRAFAPGVPMNAPGVVCNGAALYDFAQEKYVYTAFLDETVRARGTAVLTRFPAVGCEIYHESDTIHVVQPNRFTEQHRHLTHVGACQVPDLESATEPCAKLLFEAERQELDGVVSLMEETGWAADYELIFSSDHLLELTARGANKGGMVLKLAELLGVSRRHIYCIGDHANDLPMLSVASMAFAPENCIDAVRQSGARIVPACGNHALAAVIDILERERA
ncbi:MAG: HAD-IIB family hydrolase [Oscillospiraceae bacterium]